MVQEYLELVRYVLENGAKKTDRTGTGTLSLFGLQTRYDLRKGFPLLTTKKVLFDAVVRELLWFLRGSTNIHDGLTQYTPIYVVDNRLDLQVYQRSADLALGVPFNIASYALLLTMVAQECALQPGIFIYTLGDVHIYLNHINGLTHQLQRQPYALPRLTIAPKPFFDLTFADITLHEYRHHPFSKFPIAV
jgi:thymidylate synthase